MVSTQTKNTAVYTALREDIVNGNLRPGERLVISDLAKRYSISSMPIREALIRLQHDGFVAVEPHVGAHVTDFDADTFNELLLIRTELEALACRLAVPFINDVVIKEMQELVRQMGTCIEDGDAKQFTRLNKKLHMVVYCASPYGILQELIYNLWERTEYMRNLYAISMKRISESHQEHLEWIEALKHKDEQKVMEILRTQKEKQFAEYRWVINAAM